MHGFGAIMFSMDGGRAIDKNGAINVNKIQRKPWSFTIVFDEAKAVRHGYSLDALYDHVGKSAESFGNVRIGRGSWQAKDVQSNHSAQPVALCCLCEQKWVMENVKSWTTYEDERPNGEDYLQLLRRHRPYLICAE